MIYFHRTAVAGFLALLAGCGFRADPVNPGLWVCTAPGLKITFDSRDYEWTAYSDHVEANPKSTGGAQIVLGEAGGHCERVAVNR